MTNKLVVIIHSLKVPKIKKIILYETKFLVPNYSCLQNPWLWGYHPQITVLSVLYPQLNLLNPPPAKKIPGYATDHRWRMVKIRQSGTSAVPMVLVFQQSITTQIIEELLWRLFNSLFIDTNSSTFLLRTLLSFGMRLCVIAINCQCLNGSINLWSSKEYQVGLTQSCTVFPLAEYRL